MKDSPGFDVRRVRRTAPTPAHGPDSGARVEFPECGTDQRFHPRDSRGA